MSETAVVIGSNKRKALFLLAASAAFVVIGINMVRSGDGVGWFVVGFFSIGVLCALYMLWPNTIRLTVNEHGFEMKTPFRPMKLSWGDVDSFYVGKIKTKYSSIELIGIKYSPTYSKLRSGRWFASALTGMQGALPNHFNMPAKEVCALLNEWKQRDSMRAQQSVQPDRREDAVPG